MTPDSYWIFNKSYKDFLFLVLPAYITIIVAKIIHPTSWVDMVVLFIVFHVIDSGHVYLTFYRTHGHRQERASQSYYLWAPPLILITCALWYLSGGLYFWSFVTYSTLYHNLRQFYGITRWYQKKEGNFSPWPTRFLYSLMITPAVGFHFRNLGELSIYNRQEVFYHPNLTYYKISLAIFMLAMLSWLVYESFCYFKNNRQWSPGRVLSVLTPAAAYSSGLFFGDNYLQIIGPMIVAHGIGYWALMGFSMNRTFANPRLKQFVPAMVILAITALVAGTIEWFGEEFLFSWIEEGSQEFTERLLIALGVGLYLTPLYSHYLFDGFIWKSKHRQAHLIY